MIVADLMTRALVTARPETSLAEAAGLMLARRLSGLLVLDGDGRLVGVVTEGDLLRRAELGTAGAPANWLEVFLMPGHVAADYVKTHGRTVSEVMTADPICVGPGDGLAVAVAAMRKNGLKRLPVVLDGRPVGVISRFDLLAALVPLLAQDAGSRPSDTEIHDEIVAALTRETWAPKTGIRVTVTDGLVDLVGVIMSDGERQAVRVIAENIFGVVSVTDNMVFVDPGSGMAFG
jgi:CBS domain-containing protein